MDQEPTVQEWRDLFQAARGFYQLAPWKWMLDFDVFGVQDPESQEVGYVCVLGNAGKVFGLVVYVGSDGFASYVRMQTTDQDELDLDLIASLRCLTAFFEDREDLTPRDRALIKKLKLTFRGANAWPKFRAKHPGYEAWYLTSAEARFLTLALVQAQEIGQRLGDDPEFLDRAPADLYLVLVPLDKQGKRWKDEWRPPPPPPPLPPVEPVPEELLAQLKKHPRRGVWEVDLFAAPAMIQEEKNSRPYYVATLLCVHQESYFVLGVDLVPYYDRFRELPRRFANVLAQSPIDWPNRVWVRRPELASFLSPFLNRLGIRVHLSPNLPALEGAQRSLISWLKGRREPI